MDATIISVLTILFLVGFFWLVVQGRNRSQKHTVRTSIKPESHHRE